MEKFLERLRQKPESEKKAFALSLAFFITLIIFTVWATSLFNVGLSQNTANTSSPIDSLKEQFGFGEEEKEVQIKRLR
jgi:hypothetical protein